MAGADRREQLLDILAGLILNEGHGAVSIDRIAREAGIARTVVYAQFDNLDAMQAALADRGEQRIFEQIRGVLPDLDATEDIDETVLAALGGYLRAVAGDPLTWRLALLPPDGAPLPLRERVERNRAAVVAMLAPFCAAGLERRGGPAGVDAEMLARVILASGEEAGRMVLAGGDAEIERALIFTRAMLAALR